MSARKSPPSSRLTSLKDYLSQRDFKLALPSRRALRPGEGGYVDGHDTPQSWSQWAGQKIRRNGSDVATIDEVNLFPGWATKRPRIPAPDEHESAFDVSLHVSGFATSRRNPELVTRSQRAFLRLAKGFASLPKLQPTLRQSDTEIDDTLGRLHLPPRPDEISDDYEVQNLDKQFRDSGDNDNSLEIDEHMFPESSQSPPPVAPADGSISAELQRLHDNLESRLRPFWSSALSSRMVEVSVFAHPLNPQTHRHSVDCQPLLTQEILTGPDGFFSGTFKIHWKDICDHPVGVHIAFDETCFEHELLVEARVVGLEHTQALHATPTKATRVPITQSTVRVISDIDDTVKMSRILDGARAVFQNVFVKDLEDTVIPGMGEWYSEMWKCGVRFHYVSNSPFELLPVINQFISISQLPPGSIRLRSYAGRSLFNGLLSAPATRKRANVIEVLDHFPRSHFLLVGDSGEQDLELYASLAAERPEQIAGVFIRDVGRVGLDDPTGTRAEFAPMIQPRTPLSKGSMPLPGTSSPRPPPTRALSDTETQVPIHPGSIRIPRPTPKRSLPPSSYSLETTPEPKSFGSSRASVDSSSSMGSVGSSTSSSLLSMRPMRRGTMPITEGERRRWDLQNRVNRARLLMPAHIVLRVFEDPKECLEAEQIVERLISVSQPLR
ncbi:hypothetical protein HYDPIDRAFT_153245 [Hydnomerulius pinastri MD-312]|uniref:Phosphatidate phosphatase APP1 catalytic domain-containing protein n=1 Tax=Hydnomerulius pinastri MD-312 TaxID=994086 RepID=A0A0C9W2H9_9AGAM|nr:hypothetical protein HYDPIDRAFT_153245 [Hydnomerulius pinastri MD-312]